MKTTQKRKKINILTLKVLKNWKSIVENHPVVGTGTSRLHTLRKQQNPAFPVRNYIYMLRTIDRSARLTDRAALSADCAAHSTDPPIEKH